MMISEPDHAFQIFSDLVCEAVVASWNAQSGVSDTSILWPPQFANCRTDYERVLCLMKLSRVSEYSLPNSTSPSGLKSDLRAQHYRNTGNTAWKAGELDKALLGYTKTIMCAQSDIEKCLGFANRSCVLARLSAHSAVVDDVTSAIQYGYPVDRQSRLFVRRAESFLTLGRMAEARKDLELVHDTIGTSEISKANSAILQLTKSLLQRCNLIKTKTSCVWDVPYVSIPDIHEVTTRNLMKYDVEENKDLPANGDSVQQLQAALNAHGSPMVVLRNGGPSVDWELVTTKDILPGVTATEVNTFTPLISIFRHIPEDLQPATFIISRSPTRKPGSTDMNKPRGEMLMIERPYVRRILLDKILQHCSTCFRRCLNLKPCRRCSEVAFCSSACEEKAWRTDWPLDKSVTNPPVDSSRPCHRFECGQVDRISLNDYAGWKRLRLGNSKSSPNAVQAYRCRLLNIEANKSVGGPSVAGLAFACLARTDPQTLRRLVEGKSVTLDSDKLIDPDVALKTSHLSAFTGRRQCPNLLDHDFANRYESVAWLTANSTKRSMHDLWQRTVAAVFLAHCLKAGGYPIRDNSETCNEQLPMVYLAACLLHDLQAISANAHTYAVQCLQLVGSPALPTGVDLESSSPVDVGTCFYPTMSLANHSCDPNVTTTYLGDGVAALFAIHSIPAGGIAFTNYGMHYVLPPSGVYKSPAACRRQALADQYHFNCQCRACTNDWPGLNIESKIICNVCGSVWTIGKTLLSDPVQCKCTPTRQYQLLKRFKHLVSDQLGQKFIAIPMEMKSQLFDCPNGKDNQPLAMFTNPVINKHIAYAVKMLSPDGLQSFLVRPGIPYDWLQELLKALICIKYGAWFSGIQGLPRDTD